MKRHLMTVAFLLTLVVLAACTGMQLNSQSAMGEHPALSEQEMLISCSDCHRDSTPVITTEWFDSTHGLGNVKCYQCHGTFENLKKTPDMEKSCAACHANKLGEHTGNSTCWECHAPHRFSYAD